MSSKSMVGGDVRGVPRIILRVEGLALLALATAVFSYTRTSWWLYVGLFFAPDVSFAGYLAGPKAGAVAYNAVHTTVVPALLAALSLALGATLMLAIAAIWAAHVGFDRLLGYGLKYADGFGETHLGRIGRERSGP
ncbi:DUF4260 domain-containing protein [Chelatococcus sp. GCM10030263]|uniref:DUF4260 domain-containing protein n=1 Tax=Chelatococcus sp. GCM10030263 TaxID=3273387 RepID=UPI00360D9255